MSIYVIDYENTSVAGLNGIEKLLDTDVVVVFFSTNAPKIDIKAVEKIQKSAAKTVFKEANVSITIRKPLIISFQRIRAFRLFANIGATAVTP